MSFAVLPPEVAGRAQLIKPVLHPLEHGLGVISADSRALELKQFSLLAEYLMAQARNPGTGLFEVHGFTGVDHENKWRHLARGNVVKLFSPIRLV